ncbi:Hypothetical protein GSB_152563 [Giardia duodenalis]|uniref:Ribosomal RNA-processing protein 14/surfeit locus protein 6 C-terminal domain-containing protein n=2 Tax=Giardia intestinalis TaxID=5741 RepID=C6LXJ8_GIAIB|nr:Hypothetical protein GL50581_3512 [Giardia intestinalis ATCC 50581]ESU41684.1 Hypothetical protein GSB_152563 [Giardia intestinalis]
MANLRIEEIYERLASVMAALPLQVAIRPHRVSQHMLLERFENNRAADSELFKRSERKQPEPKKESSDNASSSGSLESDTDDVQAANVSTAENERVQIIDGVPRSRKAANKRALKEAITAKKEREVAIAAAAKGDRAAMDTIVDKEYDVATRRASGEKVRDDPARIRKSIKNSQSRRPRGKAAPKPQKPNFPIKSQAGFGRAPKQGCKH